jgi:UDP-N-acetylmuramoyl-tripeptide--D-alanyl-D-alanine ligase
MTAAELAGRARGAVVAGDGATAATSFGFDSRAIEREACFVALRAHRDGHDFVDAAFAAGASIVLVQREPVRPPADPARAVVLVDDTVAALGRVARSVRDEHPELHVVGITGSTGKTSTKDLLHAALAGGGELAHANPESYNNEFGLPLTMLNMPSSTRVLVTEMGERFPGDVASLCEIAVPTVGAVTNVGLAHAEHLGGPEGVARAMAELLEALPSDGLALLNADDPWTPWLADRTDARVVTVGASPTADRMIEQLDTDERLSSSFVLEGARYRVPLRGAHQAMNAAMAIVIARHFGVDPDDVAYALLHAAPSRWRMEIDVSAEGITVVNDSYNANPASMEAALRALAHLRVDGQRIAVLGDMRELGAHANESHAAVGTLAVELGIDVVVGVGRGGARIVDAARPSVPAIAVDDADAALAVVRARVATGDAVLVKASRALGLERVAAGLLRGDRDPASRGRGAA